MLRRTLIILVVALTTTTEAAWAQAPDRSKPPVFTAEEVLVISRNADLLSGLRSDPWAVRRFLDKVANVPSTTSSKKLNLDDEPTKPTFDPKQNPDLERLQRASPEAVHDLFQLLKQAGERRQQSK